MADIIKSADAFSPAERFKDMGDGTFARVVYLSGGGGGGGGGAATVADGADVTQGAVADAAVAAGAAGTVSAKLRAISRDVATLTTPGSNASSTQLEGSHVIKATPGTLFTLTILNNSGVAQYYQLHDATSLPADAAVPKAVIRVAPGGTGSFDYGTRGRAFAAGIVVTNSSTAPTLTHGGADSFYDAQYV
ncbi:MAG: hypothetical protein ACTHK2_03930 [Dokdonella sp.]|uniref:hypothetical protein n=1 Tax=Dokdonella sp. TaxID=2291710 RepID=UPI003F80A0AA